MIKNNPTPEDVKDGFDLLEYPCEFAFKAMCRASDDIDLKQHLVDIVVFHLDQQAFLDVKSNSSRTGKFESITINVRLTSRDQLEAVYKAIADSPSVVMTL